MIVGYKLIDANGTILDQWGGVPYQMPGFPNPLILPNGDQIMGASSPGPYGEWTVVEWDMDLPPTPIPQEITRRQCAKQMLAMGLISPQECLSMTKTGDMPAMVLALISTLPADQQVLAQIDFAADTYRRDNALLGKMMAAAGKDGAAVDSFFLAAAST
jgi:hypothetical protein